MRIMCGTILALSFCLAAVPFASASDTQSDVSKFVIVKGGRPCAAFELGAIPDEKAKAAAEKDVALFNKHLNAVTGSELGWVNGGSAPCQNKILIELKAIDELSKRYDWKIEFPSNGVMHVEATTTSLFTALRQILEEGCDARFLGTERSMFQFEPRKDVSVVARSRKNAARNYSLLRDIYGAKGNRRELGLKDDGLFKYTHGIPVYAFPGDYYNAKGWPKEIMPVLNGKKLECPSNLYNRWQPCYSNPETARIATENIRKYLIKHPNAKSITLGMNDNGGYCECEACGAMDAGAEKSIFSNDPNNISASYYTFANRVAEALAKEFPQLRIGLLAYTGTIMPPKFALHPSIVPMMTFDTHSAGMDETVRVKQDNVIRRWGEKIRECGIWDYSWGGGYYIPRVDFEGHAKRIKFLYENGGRAYFGENSLPDALDGPKTYLISRLLENVDADAEEILSEWYQRFAGKAAENPLREIYKLCENYWRSEAMRHSALWPARHYIYNYPYSNQFYALTAGFTACLVELAREVTAKAVTTGEKARAEVLLRHFERLDCMASFKGIAYMSPASGELVGAKDAAKMLNDFADRAESLFAAWERVRSYFLENPDFDRKGVYAPSSYELLPLLSEQFGKASGFSQEKEVVAALRRIEALDCLPSDARILLRKVFSEKAENEFSNPGFESAIDEKRIKTTLPYEIVGGNDGQKFLRLFPGKVKGVADPSDAVLSHVSAFTMVENLKPGIYMAAVTVRSGAVGGSGDLALWRQTDGNDKDWEAMHPAQLKKDQSHTFVQVRRVKDTEDGLNLKLRLTGFRGDEALDITNVQIIRIADAGKSGRGKTVSARAITAREGTVRELVGGEDAIVCRSDVYAFAHTIVEVPRILPEEKLEFTLRAMRPQGAKTGLIGAILYKQKNGGWEGGPQILWNRALSAKKWEDIKFLVTGKQLGKKNGKYLLILFKMKESQAVAVSGVSWRISNSAEKR